MRLITRLAFALAGVTLASACVAQSLGEVARQQRAKKKPADTQRRVITEEELRSSTSKEAVAADSSKTAEANEAKDSPTNVKAPKDEKQSAAELQAKIKAQKQKVRELEAKVRELRGRLDERDSPYSDIVNKSTRATAGRGTWPVCDLQRHDPRSL